MNEEEYPPLASIDTPSFTDIDKNGKILIFGWCLLGRNIQPTLAEIFINGEQVVTVPFATRRTDVLKSYPMYGINDRVGFEHLVEAPADECLNIVVCTKSDVGKTHVFSKSIWISQGASIEGDKRLEERFKSLGVFQDYPTMVIVEVTTACFLSCIMCLQRKTIESKYLERRVFDGLNKFLTKARYIYLYGLGEPTLHPEYLYFIKKSRELNPTATIHIVTNLNRIDEGIIDALVGDAPSVVTISMDGATKETYEKIRVNGSWEKLMGNIERLAEKIEVNNSKYPSILFNYVIQKDNIGEIADFVTLVNSKCHQPIIFFSNVIDCPHLSVDYGEHTGVIKDALERLTRFSNQVYGTGFQMMREVVGTKEGQCQSKGAIERPSCFAPFQTLFLNVDGGVRTCCFSSTLLGNLLLEDIAGVWHGHRYNILRQTMFGGLRFQECESCIKEGRNQKWTG